MPTKAAYRTTTMGMTRLAGVPIGQLAGWILGVALLPNCQAIAAADNDSESPGTNGAHPQQTAKMLVDYYHRMCAPKPFVVRKGNEFETHRRVLRKKLLQSTGLWPLPDRVPLDAHGSEPLDHPWCTVRRVAYQLWPGVYANGLLFMPKHLPEKPAPAMLCPHGHWNQGNAYPDVQRRCLNFARLGYVTFSSTQYHYEDQSLGVSHQTLMIWNNMRALDYLETVPQVDKTRIGVAGASGGGLQAQMLAALDARVKAVTIVGLTCDFREIMFPHSHHCACNHFPGVMRFTDHPEISALAMPAAVQYLTMNDWTKNFQRDNLPTIKNLYAAAGLADRVDAKYWPTPHLYDKQKRERTYHWMEKWVRGKEPVEGALEPKSVTTFPIQTLVKLSVDVAADKGFEEISRIYRKQHGYRVPTIAGSGQWDDFRQRMTATLRDLLGEDAVLAADATTPQKASTNVEGHLLVERVNFPSEAGILVPTTILRSKTAAGKLPVVLICAKAGQAALLEKNGPESARHFARDGSLVVLPDLRIFGALLSTGGNNAAGQEAAWERNGIVWGRPVSGMACTDLRAVLDGLASRPDADMTRIKAIGRDSGAAAIAVLLAAALDDRLGSVDVDLQGCCYEKRNLPLIPFVLQHGDVLQWAALLAKRDLTIRNIPRQAGDPAWLAAAFSAKENRGGLHMEPQ